MSYQRRQQRRLLQIELSAACLKWYRGARDCNAAGSEIMQDLILRLIEGDKQLAIQFTEAKEIWDEFLETYGHLSTAELAEKMTLRQSTLESPFEGDRPFAKEMLPLTCLASLWSREADGYADPAFAKKVVNAIETSSMSHEVKNAWLKQALATFPLG